VLRAPWNRDLLDELESAPFGKQDDQMDALASAFNYLALHAPVPFAAREQSDSFIDAMPADVWARRY
jgi:hypothetical protein